MCLNDKSHESKVLRKMTNIILKHMLSPEEEGSYFCFLDVLRVGGSSSGGDGGPRALKWLTFTGVILTLIPPLHPRFYKMLLGFTQMFLEFWGTTKATWIFIL